MSRGSYVGGGTGGLHQAPINIKDIIFASYNLETSILRSNSVGPYAGSTGGEELTELRVGSGYDGSGLVGEIYEIIYFDGIITTAETTTIRDYLNTKWN